LQKQIKAKINKLKREEKQSLEGSLKYIIPYTYIQKILSGQGMPCLTGFGLAFLVNLYRQHFLELLQGDSPNRLNSKKFMNKARFYVVQLHQPTKI
jgi:hypothetical protein